MAQQEARTPAKYRQIAADLRARIEAGEYPVGSQMPTKDELMTSYGAALATVDSALRVLAKLGMVQSRQGSGTFVLAQQAAEAEADQLAGDVATLKADLASLLEKVSEIEAKLIDLYGKNGYEYRAGTENGGQQKRRARHG